MKRGDIIEVYIEDFIFPSTGIGYYNDKLVKVEKALKGQTVNARVKKKNSERIIAKTDEVIKKADYEVDDVCVHFNNCGGCSFQTIPYELQVEMKGNYVKDIFNQNNIEVKQFDTVERSPKDLAYRNKMEFTFGDEVMNGPMTLGMHKRGSFMTIVTTDQCRIVNDDFNKILRGTIDYFTALETPFYHKKRAEGLLRNLIVRKGEKTGEIIVNLVTTSQLEYDKAAFCDMLKAIELEGKIVGIVNTINDNVADFVYCDRLDILWGQDYFYEEVLDLKFKISPFSFFQTNTLATEKLYTTVLDYIDDLDDKLVFDLYSGTGSIGQIAALKADKVIGIEIVEEAVEAAKVNAKLNSLDNCEFMAGDVLKVIDEVKEKPDIIIIDPPRMGVHVKALKKIIDFNCKHMIYVSCNPKTLGENLVELTEAGYTVEKVKVFDNFPHTGHIETVVKLVKK